VRSSEGGENSVALEHEGGAFQADTVRGVGTHGGSANHCAITDVKDGMVQRTGHVKTFDRSLVQRTSDVRASSVDRVQTVRDPEYGHRYAVRKDPHGVPLDREGGVLDSKSCDHRFTTSPVQAVEVAWEIAFLPLQGPYEFEGYQENPAWVGGRHPPHTTRARPKQKSDRCYRFTGAGSGGRGQI
jgi:hypothetical protein